MNPEETARLVFRIINSRREVVFLVGSGLTAPELGKKRGVPGTAGMIEMMKAQLRGLAQDDLQHAVERHGNNSYQAAFEVLGRLAGQDACNGVVRQAVLQARTRASKRNVLDVESLRKLEEDADGWHLSRGAWAIGVILARYAGRIGRTVLTTNFDPLIEISVRQSGGDYFSTSLHGDGDLAASYGTVPHIVHLHGYWIGSDTLHTPAQLMKPRPMLGNSLRHLLEGKLLVVLGYGGWEDIFTRTLLEVLADPHAAPEVVWGFRQTGFEELTTVNPWLAVRLEPYLGHRIHPFFEIELHDALVLTGAAAREKMPPKQGESELFWKIAEVYIRGFLGDQQGITDFEAALSPEALKADPRGNVCTQLKITPEIVRAVGEMIYGSIERRTEVVLSTLRLRSMVDETTEQNPSSGDPDSFRSGIRRMFLGKDHSWQ